MIRSNAFESIKNLLREKYGKKIFISDTSLSDTIAKFPAVSIVESNNTVNSRYSTFESIENVAICDFDVNVYTNDEKNKDRQALEIMTLICDEFSRLRYLRTYESPINNLLDSSIVRRNAKFKKSNITK